LGGAAIGLSAFIPLIMSSSSSSQKYSLKRCISYFPTMLYNTMVVSMTSTWYENVLTQLEDGECILDVGVGTAGALIQCADIIKSKNLRIVGLDYNALYIEEAKIAVIQAGLENHVNLVCMSIYDEKQLPALVLLLQQLSGSRSSSSNLTTNEDKQFFDSIYFSGSFSLLPSPIDALHSVSKLLPSPEKGGGNIYITQTFQRYSPPFFNIVKPLIKYVTTIDFGRLISTKEILEIYEKSGLKLVEHKVIENSIDSFLQGAYLSILSTSKKEKSISAS